MKDWSANLETQEYIEDRHLLVADAIAAVLETERGYFVNLAVADIHGNPDTYLVPALHERFAKTVRIEFIDQCGCGGYVYKVTRL